MSKLLKVVGMWLLILMLYAPLCSAQENQKVQNTQTTQPLKPDQPILPDANTPATNDEDANVIPAVVTIDPENPSLTGARGLFFGSAPTHSSIIPRFDFLSSVSTNGLYSSSSAGNQVATTQYLLGGVTLEKVGEVNQLSVNYVGGKSFSPNGDTYNASTQLLGLTDHWMRARWSALVADQLSYASDQYFNAGGVGIGAPGLGTVGANILPTFNPGQTVIVGRTPLLNNSSVGEVDYQANRRGSFTFVGSYNMLHYYGTGLINNDSREFEAGYNYQFSQRDTVSVSYLFNAIRFSRNIESINVSVVQASYRHQFAGKFSIQISGGPDFASINATGFPSSSYTSWTLNSSLLYTRNRINLGLSYYHMLTGGAGIFAGAETDTVSGSMGRRIGRFWSFTVNTGYSRNSSLNSLLTTAPTVSVNSLIAGVGISRPIGREINAFVNYGANYQTSGHAICTGPGCGTDLVNHQVSAGFGWHPRPIPIE